MAEKRCASPVCRVRGVRCSRVDRGFDGWLVVLGRLCVHRGIALRSYPEAVCCREKIYTLMTVLRAEKLAFLLDAGYLR